MFMVRKLYIHATFPRIFRFHDLSRIPRVRIPVPMEALPEHTYPKYPAPVLFEEAGERVVLF